MSAPLVEHKLKLLFETQLDEKSKQQVGKQIRSMLGNAVIGFDEAEAKRNLIPIIDLINSLFAKAGMKGLDVENLLNMPSRQALQQLANITIDDFQSAFDRALEKSGGIKIDFGDTDLSAMTKPLKAMAKEVAEINNELANTTRKSVAEIESSFDKLRKKRSKNSPDDFDPNVNIGKTADAVEKTLNSSGGSVGKDVTKAIENLTIARGNFAKSKESGNWVKEYQDLLKFVNLYEKAQNKFGEKLFDSAPDLKDLYDILSSKSKDVRSSLSDFVNMARGNGTTEDAHKPWAREKTLQEAVRVLGKGLNVEVKDSDTGETKSEALLTEIRDTLKKGINVNANPNSGDDSGNPKQNQNQPPKAGDGPDAELKNILARFVETTNSGSIDDRQLGPIIENVVRELKKYDNTIPMDEAKNVLKRGFDRSIGEEDIPSLISEIKNLPKITSTFKENDLISTDDVNILKTYIQEYRRLLDLGNNISGYDKNIREVLKEVITEKWSSADDPNWDDIDRASGMAGSKFVDATALAKAIAARDLSVIDKPNSTISEGDSGTNAGLVDEKIVATLKEALSGANLKSDELASFAEKAGDKIAQEQTLAEIRDAIVKNDGGVQPDKPEINEDAAKEKADKRRNELAEQMELYSGDDFNIEESEGQKVALQEILNALKQEDLLTDELLAKYNAINSEIDERISLLKDVQLAYGILDEEGKIDYKSYDLGSVQQALAKSKELLDSIPKRALDDDDIAIGVESIQQENLELEKRISLLQQVEQGLIDIDSVDDIMSESGDLDSKLSRLGDIASAWGSNIKDSEVDEDDDAIEALEEFEATYDRIVLKLASGRKIEILPNAKGLRALHKYDDGIDSGAYGETEIEDIEFVRKENLKSLLPVSDGLKAHTYDPSDEQKAYVLKLGEEYRAIMEILERGDSEFESALIERAKAIQHIMLETVRGNDGDLVYEYQNVYGGSTKTAASLGDWRQQDNLLHNIDSDKIDDSQRQAAIDLIYKELEAEKQLEAERIKVREAAKQREVDTFKEKYSSASEEEKKLLYEIIELEKEHRTLSDIGDEESHKLALKMLEKVREKYNALEKLNDGLLDAYDDVGFKRAEPYVSAPSSVPGALTGKEPVDTTKEREQLFSLKGSVDSITAAVKEKTQEFLNEQSVVKKVSDSETHALDEVEKKVTAIRVALSNVNTLLNNIQKGNDISALSDVKVTVNYPEQQDDYSKLADAIKSSIEQLNEGKQGDAESQWEKSVITLLTRIKVHTHNTVRQVRDNLVGKVDEKLSELNGLKNATYSVKIVNDGQSKDDGKWALEDTLRNKTNDLLGKIVTHSNATKTNTKDTAKDSTLKQVLNSINTKVKSQSITFGPPPANQSAKKPEITGAGGNLLKMYEQLGALGVQKNALDLNSDERKGIKEKIRLLKEEIDKKKKLVTVDKQLIVEAQKKGAADQRAQMMTVQGHKSDIQAAKDEKKAISDLLAAYERLGTLRAKRDALPKGAEREELQKEIKLETSRLWKRSKKLGVDSAKTSEASAFGEHSVQTDKLVTKTQLLGKYQKSILSMENGSESYKNAQNRINELTAEIALIRKKITLTQEEKLELDELIKKNEELINAKKSEQADKEAKSKEREASIHNAQVEAEVVKELIKLYEQLGRAQATENVDEASRLRDVVSTERGKLSSVDYATDMKFKDAKSKGFEAEKTKAANAALKTQEDAIKRLNKLYQEYGVLVERASAATGHFGEQLQDEVTDKSQEIMTLRESIGFITTEMLDGFDVSFERGRQIESTKQYEALAKKSDSDEATRLKNIANLEKEIGKLRADADAATNVGVQNALEEEIQLRQQLIELQRQGLEMDALDEAYYRQAAANRTKQAKAEASQEIKDVKNAFKQADKDAKKQAAEDKRQAKRNAMFGKAGNAIGRAENIWMSAQGEDEPLPPGLSKQVENLYNKMVALRTEQDKVRNAESVTPEQQEDLRNHTIEMNALTNEVSELYSEYQKLSGANVDETKTKTTTLTGKSSLDDYAAELKQYVKTIEHGKAQIKGFDATTKTLTYTVKTGKNEFTEYTAAVRRADGALVSMRGATKRTETFLEATKRKMKELTSYMSGMALFSRIGQELRRGVQYVREIDLALTELKKVTNETEEEYDQFLKTAANTGARLGTTISAVTEATSTFAKLGYTMEQATEMAESAIVYKNVGDNIESTGDAADSIISTMKGFGLEASESMAIVDRFNEVGNRFAITSQGIGEALRLSASALSEGSNSLDESIGLITAANEVVNDPSSVGKISLPT